jgi:hypothetical protein
MRQVQTTEGYSFSKRPRGSLPSKSAAAAIYPHGNAALSAVHLLLIQTPTAPMIATTATSIIPSNAVYSINEAPSSSLPRRRPNLTRFDIMSEHRVSSGFRAKMIP